MFSLFILAGDPTPLAPEDRHTLSWEAAVERLFDAAEARELNIIEQLFDFWLFLVVFGLSCLPLGASVSITGKPYFAIDCILTSAIGYNIPQQSRSQPSWSSQEMSPEVRVLSGPFERPSEASFSRLAYDLHFGVMKDDAVLGDIVRRTTFGEEEYTRYWGELSDRLLAPL